MAYTAKEEEMPQEEKEALTYFVIGTLFTIFMVIIIIALYLID